MENTYISHHGVKGQRWGVRNDDKPNNGNKSFRTDRGSLAKTLGLLAGGAAIGASAIGAAWYLKNRSNLNAMKLRKQAISEKAKATRAANKAAGLYTSFKNVNVTISKGNDFVKQFMDVKVAKLFIG